MSNKVDKLFKEKLEEHSLQPSAQAWEKVEAHLGKKNKMVLWVRVAAAVGLVGLMMFAWMNWNSSSPKEEIVKKEAEVRSQELGVRSQEPELKQTPKVIEKQKEIKKQKTQPKVVPPVIEEVQEQQQTEQVAIVPEPKVEEQPTVVETPPTTLTPQPTTKKGITLTYSLPPVKKQEAPLEPLVAEKKTGLERVLEIAKEVKSGDALADLRQAKDDIFALDFRKDKNKKQ